MAQITRSVIEEKLFAIAVGFSSLGRLDPATIDLDFFSLLGSSRRRVNGVFSSCVIWLLVGFSGESTVECSAGVGASDEDRGPSSDSFISGRDWTFGHNGLLNYTVATQAKLAFGTKKEQIFRNLLNSVPVFLPYPGVYIYWKIFFVEFIVKTMLHLQLA